MNIELFRARLDACLDALRAIGEPAVTDDARVRLDTGLA
jgi:hypothetical protein